MLQALLQKKKKIAVIGLGYVGLPIALEFGKYFEVIGFDINKNRVQQMREGIDPSMELSSLKIKESNILLTSNPDHLKDAHFFIIAVPTPVDQHKVPNLEYLISASTLVGQSLKKGDYVVYESTVYPGCTEEDCLPILEKCSGLKLDQDFKIGYSPERINPGDQQHTLTKILKIVAGNDAESTQVIADVYGQIIEAGIYKTSSIKVAEAAKVIENTQRDINIALMNELSIIFDKMDIDTQEVLNAANTKWNFLKFFPGLVGGHCIGVDPYYLTYKAQQFDYYPQVILSGRRINDEMPLYLAKKLTQIIIKKGKAPLKCRVLVMGITFKENVSDIRNSKVAELVGELQEYSFKVDVLDPLANPDEVQKEYGFSLIDQVSMKYEAIVIAVKHKAFAVLKPDYYYSILQENAIVMDIKSLLHKEDFSNYEYWRL